MIIQQFHELLNACPNIKTAYEEFKQSSKEYIKKNAKNDDDFKTQYHTALSNFVNGALHCRNATNVIVNGENLRLRTANIDDYDYINLAEQDKDSVGWVGNWSLGWRIHYFGDNDFLQTILEKHDGTAVGFIDFRYVLHETDLYLKRFVITEKRKGYGKEAMLLSQKMAFEILDKNRLFLGTRVGNTPALTLYPLVGFTLVNPDVPTNFQMFKEEYFSRSSP